LAWDGGDGAVLCHLGLQERGHMALHTAQVDFDIGKVLGDRRQLRLDRLQRLKQQLVGDGIGHERTSDKDLGRLA